MDQATPVLIPNFNNRPWLLAAVDSLVKNAGAPVKIVVIDDLSTDDPVEEYRIIVQHFGGTIIRRKTKGGCPAAVNDGLRAFPQGDVVRVDGDILMNTPGWLLRARATAKANPEIGVVGCRAMYSRQRDRILSFGERLISWWGCDDRRQNRNRDELFTGEARQTEVRQCDAVLGVFQYITGQCRELVPFTDEQFFPAWFEDVDYCLMARRAGFDVVADGQIEVVHFADVRKPGQRPGVEKKAVLGQLAEKWEKKWGWNFWHPTPPTICQKYRGTKIPWFYEELDQAQARHPWVNPRVDILVPNWNGGAHLRHLIDSLDATDYPSFNLLVLDQGSGDDSMHAMQVKTKYPKSAIRLDHNLGAPAAFNRMISETSAPFFMRMDNDAFAHQREWLRTLVDTLRANPRAACVGPLVLDGDGQMQSAGYRFHPRTLPDAGHLVTAPPDCVRVAHVQGCCVLYRRSAFDRVGPFSLEYGPSQWEDVDHHIACYKAGFEVLCDRRAEITHTGQHPNTPDALSLSRHHRNRLNTKWGRTQFAYLDTALDVGGRIVERL